MAPFDAQAAKAYGPIRAAYKDRNRDALDKLVASHAVALDVTLVTNNEADFVNYAGLVVENWVNNHCTCDLTKGLGPSDLAHARRAVCKTGETS